MIIEVDGNQQQAEASLEMQGASGLAMAQQYMSANGSTSPRHLRKQKTMTRAQYEEQKMNEAQGYPSSLDEAAKVKNLENQMTNLQSMIHTLVERSTPQPNQLQPHPISVATPSYPDHVYAPAIQPAGPSTPSPKRSVTLSNGQTVQVDPSKFAQPIPPSVPMSVSQRTLPPMSLGLVNEAEVEDTDLWLGDEPKEPEFVNDPRNEQIAAMSQMVREWLLKKDALTFFRRANAKIISRHAGYTGWSPEMQAQFKERFVATLTDPVFLANIVRKVNGMQMGYALAPEKVAEIVVMAAGWVAFALAGI